MSHGSIRLVLVALLMWSSATAGSHVAGSTAPHSLAAAATLALIGVALAPGPARGWAIFSVALATAASGAHVRSHEDRTRVDRGPVRGLLVAVEQGARSTTLVMKRGPGDYVDVRSPVTGDPDLDRLQEGVSEGSLVSLPARRGTEGRSSVWLQALVLARPYAGDGPSMGAADLVRRARARIRSRVHAMQNGASGEPARALVGALLTGRREGLSPESRLDLRDAGMVHLAVVSGLHVGWIVGWSVILAAPAAGRRSRSRLALASIAALGCGLLFDPAAPVGRAALALGAASVARLAGRSCGAIAGLSIACATLSFLDARLVTTWSFLLTVSATGAILIACDPSGELWRRGDRASEPCRVRGLVAPGLVIAPLVLAMTGRMAPWGVIGSLAGLPAVVLTLLTGIAATALQGTGAGELLERIATGGAGAILRISAALSAWPGSGSISAPAGPIWCALTVSVALASLGASRGRTRRTWLVIYTAMWGWPVRPGPIDATRARAEVIDVGQGQAVLLQEARTAVLVDAGDDRTRKATERILGRLARSRRRRLDVLVVTHDDRDHAGGAPLIVRSTRPRLVAVPANLADSRGLALLVRTAARRGIPVAPLERGDVLEAGPLKLTAIHPQGGERGETNEESLALLAESSAFSVLIPGDAGRAAESCWRHEGLLPVIDLLIVGHHGSSTASAMATIDDLRPRFAAASCGAENRYGHPHPATRRTLSRFGVTLIQTRDRGDLVFEYVAGRMRFRRRTGR